ncbi:hypothetical protein GCM10007079_08670 [Nocardiopsis terrae]|uniref:Polyketide biosynthesis enoyl-CoA hydratase PksH n=1 Tax=Nocardiopsis terrae TaxID=372655 RepID=A0ABR9HDP1_9ACTN|nr:enoyl-CoA hydratase-related protein [Nocardiopsis terrae]MBE1456915.1 polyketide biosynthesis enoyl-CoA hydratase PksH [Nocardiopsis terrae]GHC74415.1 hypothetical protein GCM10007079_08670 [Nocardiopsis terrae]
MTGTSRGGAVTLSRGRGFLRAVMDRADRRNPIDPDLLDGLAAAVTAAEDDAACRVLVLSAHGEHFCSGTDLWEASVGEVPSGGTLPYWDLLERLTRTQVVTVALVDGHATAGGVGLAAACDLVLAGPRARFRLTEALVGLVPAMALPFVARRTGQQRAFYSTLLAEEIAAEEAVGTGIADAAGPDGEDLLRRHLVWLSRVDRATVSVLKEYRGRLFPQPEGLGNYAGEVFLELLADPRTRERFDRLRLRRAE